MNRPAWVAKPKFLILAIGLPVLILGGVSSALIVTNSENQSETTEVEATSTTTTSTTAVPVVEEEVQGWINNISVDSRNAFNQCFAGRIPRSEVVALRTDLNYLYSMEPQYKQIVMDCYEKLRQTNAEIGSYNYNQHLATSPPLPPRYPTCDTPPDIVGMTPNEVRQNISQFRDLYAGEPFQAPLLGPCIPIVAWADPSCEGHEFTPDELNNAKIIVGLPPTPGPVRWFNMPFGVKVLPVCPPVTPPTTSTDPPIG